MNFTNEVNLTIEAENWASPPKTVIEENSIFFLYSADRKAADKVIKLSQQLETTLVWMNKQMNRQLSLIFHPTEEESSLSWSAFCVFQNARWGPFSSPPTCVCFAVYFDFTPPKNFQEILKIILTRSARISQPWKVILSTFGRLKKSIENSKFQIDFSWFLVGFSLLHLLSWGCLHWKN